MKRLLALASLLLLLTACRSNVTEADVAAATLYFPPTFKYTEEPRYCFSSAERERALREYWEQGADTLFELVVDPEGRVRKARLLRTHVREEHHERMEDHARAMVFTPDPGSELYRAFYFPTRYDLDATFEWIGD